MRGDSTRPAAPSVRTYRGGCSCGAVLYEVELDLASQTAAASSVWEHAVRPSGFRLLAGDESLQGLQLSSEHVHHFYCERCGVRSFTHHAVSEPRAFYSVDLKCLHTRVSAT